MKAIVGDITKLKVEAIVNASNGVGPMGRGVAGAIGQAGGPVLRNEVRRICEAQKGFEAGEYYKSCSGDLEQRGIKNVYHAVTMKYPGGPTSVAIIQQAMQKTLDAAVKDGIKSIAFPGLGTGIGQLNKDQVASAMASLAEKYGDRIEVTIVDLDKEFIEMVKARLKTEEV